MELSTPLVDFLLRAPVGWTSRSRANITATAMALVRHWELSGPARLGFRTGRYGVDAKLLLDLYRICPGSLRVELICSMPFRRIDPSAFEPRFCETYGRRLTVFQRRDLALALEGYLWIHPARSARFASVIQDLIRSSEWEYRLRGLGMVAHLSNLPEADRKRILQATRDKSSEIRCQAFNGLCELAKRRSKISDSLRAFCMSPEVRVIAFDRYQGDPDVDVQTCAYYFLKAREPRAGHKPPKGMPVPPPRRKRPSHRRLRGHR